MLNSFDHGLDKREGNGRITRQFRDDGIAQIRMNYCGITHEDRAQADFFELDDGWNHNSPSVLELRSTFVTANVITSPILFVMGHVIRTYIPCLRLVRSTTQRKIWPRAKLW